VEAAGGGAGVGWGPKHLIQLRHKAARGLGVADPRDVVGAVPGDEAFWIEDVLCCVVLCCVVLCCVVWCCFRVVNTPTAYVWLALAVLPARKQPVRPSQRHPKGKHPQKLPSGNRALTNHRMQVRRPPVHRRVLRAPDLGRKRVGAADVIQILRPEPPLERAHHLDRIAHAQAPYRRLLRFWKRGAEGDAAGLQHLQGGREDDLLGVKFTVVGAAEGGAAGGV